MINLFQAMVLSNPTDIRLPPVKIGDDVPPSARGVMRSLADLVSQCTAIQPDSRPSFAEILEACNPDCVHFSKPDFSSIRTHRPACNNGS